MKEIKLPSQLNQFVNIVLDALVDDRRPSEKLPPVKSRPERRDFYYYIQLIDNDTLEVVGHLADIGSGGFKLDSQKPLPINKEYRFIMNLTGAVANKSFMEFAARSRWCRVDPLDPFVYNVGFQLVRIAPEDLEIFNRIMEKFGRDRGKSHVDLRRSNKW